MRGRNSHSGTLKGLLHTRELTLFEALDNFAKDQSTQNYKKIQRALIDEDEVTLEVGTSEFGEVRRRKLVELYLGQLKQIINGIGKYLEEFPSSPIKEAIANFLSLLNYWKDFLKALVEDLQNDFEKRNSVDATDKNPSNKRGEVTKEYRINQKKIELAGKIKEFNAQLTLFSEAFSLFGVASTEQNQDQIEKVAKKLRDTCSRHDSFLVELWPLLQEAKNETDETKKEECIGKIITFLREHENPISPADIMSAEYVQRLDAKNTGPGGRAGKADRFRAVMLKEIGDLYGNPPKSFVTQSEVSNFLNIDCIKNLDPEIPQDVQQSSLWQMLVADRRSGNKAQGRFTALAAKEAASDSSGHERS